MTAATPGSNDYAAIVVGTGIAGLVAALHATKAGRIAVVAKSNLTDSNTSWAQGGLAAAMGDDDDPGLHFRDTVAAGAGLVDENAARVLCDEAPAAIRELQAAGIAFDMHDATLALGREAAHARNRIVHAGGDRTGINVAESLLRAISRSDMEIIENHTLTGLIREGGRVRGVELASEGGANTTLAAEAVVLATGGAGQLYSHTTNPAVATGDGIAAAFDAGALVADLEFFQFHPTAFRLHGFPPFLISEAVRGEGAVLRTVDGRRFMPDYDPQAELAPRDVVARAIRREMQIGGTDHVLLDCRAIRGVDLAARFPGIHAFCAAAGIEMSHDPIPVAPAAHYFMGGVLTDTEGRTSVPGLYAAGEVACTGVHGANRLASNSLIEGAVFGRRTGDAIAAGNQAWPTVEASADAVAPGHRLPASVQELRRLMWDVAGIERDGEGLQRGLAEMETWTTTFPGTTRGDVERRSLALLARLVVEAANRRRESRGAHYRRDFPERDDRNWQRRQVFRRAD